MEYCCCQEIERLHRFFEDWFMAKLPNETDVFDTLCASVFADDMVMIPPSGVLVQLPDLLTRLKEAYGCHENKDFRIEIRDVRVNQNFGGDGAEYCLVSYQEWQQVDQTPSTLRQSTVLFRQSKSSTPHGVEWVHLHETWIQPDSTTEARGKHRFLPRASISIPSPASNSSHISKRRFLYPRLEEEYEDVTLIRKDDVVVGIRIHNWNITTQQGAIADDSWLQQATERLTELSQPLRQHLTSRAKEAKNRDKYQRRLSLPEMVFSHAQVSLESTDGLRLTWSAYPALKEWAQAHQQIPLGSQQMYSGVQVLQSVDAAIWQVKSKESSSDLLSSNFHFDWTFSTPHASTSTMDVCWRQLESSGIKQHLLQDKSVPILLFDEVVLYEDDLHDNGHVQLSVKVRVMPTCAFCLERLWLRVDGVLIRVRDTRVLLEFFNGGAVYRDVVWRECPWDNLESNGLPTDVRSWCAPPLDQTTEQQAWQDQLLKLPEVELPDKLTAHAVLDQGS